MLAAVVVLLLLQHVARGAVGTPGLASIVEVGVPPSIRHLPPVRGVRRASHGMLLAIFPLVIQTGGYLQVCCQDGRRAVWGLGKGGGAQSGPKVDNIRSIVGR